MAKTAYLVKYTVTTRIVIDTPAPAYVNEKRKLLIEETARKNVTSNIDDYIHMENLESIKLDNECPYEESEDTNPLHPLFKNILKPFMP